MQHILIPVLLAAMASGCAAQALTSGRFAIRDDSAAREVRFSAQDRAAIQEYYRNSRKSTGNNAPAIVRNEPAPAALAGRALPPALEKGLSPLPAGVVRKIFAHDVVLMQGNTRLVLDVLPGVAGN